MYTLFIVLTVIASVILVLFVLVQNSKGGGLASSFSSSNQILGVRKTTDTLEKATWILISTIVVLSIISSGFSKSYAPMRTSEISGELGETEVEQAPQNINFDDVVVEIGRAPCRE